MSQQPDVSPPEIQETRQPLHSPPGKHAGPPAPVWLQRVSVVILVVFCFYVGVLLVLLPWTPYWQENHWVFSAPLLASLMRSGITRGIVSGLGVIDFWIGISEIIHFREYRA